MSRLAAVEKGEYYPTPLTIVDKIATYLEPLPANRGAVRILDPCAGKGQAARRLADILRQHTTTPVEAWGVELSPDRAREAEKVLDRVLNAPFEAVTWSPRSRGIASVLFLNPPYDVDVGGRVEFAFLETATKALVPRGVLVYIVPVSAVDYRTTSFMQRAYKNVKWFRFGDSDDDAGFERFKQVVIMGAKKYPSEYSRYLTQDEYEAAQSMLRTSVDVAYKIRHGGLDDNPIPVSLPASTKYLVPVARRDAKMRRSRYTPEEISALAQSAWVNVEAHLANTMLTSNDTLPQPLVPPRTGHIAQIVAAGLTGVIETDGRVFKGRVVKTVVVEPDPRDPNKEVARDHYETHVVEVSPRGLRHLDMPYQVEKFLQDNIQVFKRYISERFNPYGNHISQRENLVLDTLSTDKQLPGVARRGLLPKQREVAVALTRAVRRYGVGHLVAEMGFGKTRTSLAAIELMGAYPALIICPPHLVDKWAREVEASVPDAVAHVVESITDFERVRAQYRPGQKLVVVVSRSRIKLGPGLAKATATRYTLTKKGRDLFKDAVKEYHAARTRLLDMVEQDAGADAIAAQREAVTAARRAALRLAIKVETCPECGAPVRQKTQHCTAERNEWDWDNEAMVRTICHAPLFQLTGKRRWPLADYIRKKARGFFGVLVADEVHQYKAKNSDQAWAFGVLAHVIPAVITLTGTFFGGPASSIFWLLYRTQRDVRDDYAFTDAKRWVQRFGVMETTFKYEEDEYSHNNGKRRRRVSVKERPGISPGVVRYTLPTTVFVSIKDLGVALPDFQEEFVTLPMTRSMQEDMRQVEAFTWMQLKTHWPHYTSSWLQWNLARPNSCFRAEEIAGLDRVLLRPSVTDEAHPLLPKEEWLLNTIKAELAAGRRVVVYVRQTGTRDIRQRLVDILASAGIANVGVLKQSVSPRQREAWLRKNNFSVLVTNPKLVETGLDLVQYSTVVFYEVEYSLYTLWQACRRVWRLGQTRPVKVFYLAYEDTLEEKAYALIGQKIKAAQLLYGEEVSSALVEDAGDASLVMALLKAIEDGEDLKVNQRTHLFADHTGLVSDAATGSPTARSTRITTVSEWLAERGLTLDQVRPPRRRRRGRVPDGQLAFNFNFN